MTATDTLHAWAAPYNLGTWANPAYVEMLKSLWARGWTAAQIATELNRHGGNFTRNAVLGKQHRLKLGGRRQDVDETLRHQRAMDNARRRNEGKRARRAGRALLQPPKLPASYVPPPIPADVPPPRNLSILDLATGDCRWPVSDEPPHRFCGHAALAGSSYCSVHTRMAHA